MSYAPPPGQPGYPPPGWGPPGPPGPPPGPPGPPPRPSSANHGYLLAVFAGLAVVVVGLAGLVAFSMKESGSSEHDDYVEALAVMAKASANAKTDDEADCLAEGQVDALGTDTLAKIGTPEELQADPAKRLSDLGLRATPTQAQDLYDVLEDCIGAREAFRRRAADQGDSPATVNCYDEAIDDDMMKQLTVASYVDGPEFLEKNPELNQALNEATVDCAP
jgi:hypothetical protein